MDELRYYTQIGKPLHGGMGIVYHLRHKLWDMDLAMKQPLPKMLQNDRDKKRFYTECERWIGLGVHPNLVQCFFVNQVDGVPCAFSEWIGNGSVSQHINGPLYAGGKQAALSRILDVSIQAAMGLRYSHEHDVLHLDVKPDNILLDKDGTAKITDFGISCMCNEIITKFPCTPAYCAPEQKARGTLGKYTDIYCWAVTVLHMLIGELAWPEGVVVSYSFDNLITKARVDVPERLKILLAWCVREEPSDRPQSFDAVLDRLLLLWKQTYHSEYPRQYYGDNTLTWDTMNNRAISFWEMGKSGQAKEIWHKVNRESLGHVQAGYNELLYDWRYEGRAEYAFSMHAEDAGMKFTREKNKSHIRGEGYLHYLESRWAFSTGAYALACQYAEQAAKRAPNDPIVLDNRKMVSQYCDQHGPKMLGELDLTKHLIIKDKLIHLGFMPDGKLIAMSPDGKMEIFDTKGTVSRRAKTKLTEINLTAVSRDGRYLALGHTSKTKVDGGYPWEIRVVDLKNLTGLLKISGSSDLLRMISILDDPNGGCRVVAKCANETLDWDIPATKQSWVEGQGAKRNNHKQLFEDLHGMVSLVSAGSDHYMGVSSHIGVVWDKKTMKKQRRGFLYGVDKCARLNLTPIPGKPYVIHGGVCGGYEVVDYESMRVITREVLHNVGSGYCRYPDFLSVSPDGGTLALCWGSTLQFWRLPDYRSLPEPLWAVCRFRDCDLTFEQKRRYDAALSALRVKLTELEQKGGKLAGSDMAAMISHMGVIKEFCWNVDDYLELSARASFYLPVTDLDVSRRRLINTVTGLKCSLTAPSAGNGRFRVFTADGAFYAQQAGHLIKLMRTADNAVLETLNVGTACAMGFTDDRRYLVRSCNEKDARYELFQLEWLFEETPVEK